MNITAADIHAEIAKVCPIQGVSIDAFNNKASWVVHYDPAATPAQKTAAQNTIQAIDVNVDVVRDPLDVWNAITLKIAFNHENRIRALEGKAAITVAQFKAAVRAILSGA